MSIAFPSSVTGFARATFPRGKACAGEFSLLPPRGPIPLVKGKCPEGTKGIGKVARRGRMRVSIVACGGHRGRTQRSALTDNLRDTP